MSFQNSIFLAIISIQMIEIGLVGLCLCVCVCVCECVCVCVVISSHNIVISENSLGTLDTKWTAVGLVSDGSANRDR